MGSTFVNIEKDRGFWMTDDLLEVWLRFLALHIREPRDRDSALTTQISLEIRNNWLLASLGCFTGFVPHGLDRFASTYEGRQIIVQATQSLLAELDSAPEVISKDFLNLMGTLYSFSRDLQTSKLIEVGQAFLGLIKGQSPGDDYMIFWE